MKTRNWYKTAQIFDYGADLSPLLKKFAYLDQLLTNSEPRTAEQQAYQYKDKFDFSNEDNVFEVLFNNFIYYLSDGGYSRIVINDDGTLRLTYNSTDRVKSKWDDPDAQDFVHAIEEDIYNLKSQYE